MARNAVENYSILHGTLFHSYAAVMYYQITESQIALS